MIVLYDVWYSMCCVTSFVTDFLLLCVALAVVCSPECGIYTKKQPMVFAYVLANLDIPFCCVALMCGRSVRHHQQLVSRCKAVDIYLNVRVLGFFRMHALQLFY